ncbi:MAG TPA: RNA methyltransferase [Solirubrobacteraceae bacterium]|nr:RNA methyltransferase [Solirubrobacteraceae bacterium]
MTTTIESPHNPGLRDLRRLQRRRERARSGRFLAEGEDLIAAAAEAGWEPLQGYRAAGSGLGGERFRDVTPAALAAVSALGSGTRAIGVYPQRWCQTALGPLCVYLHGLADPGNVGTVLRCAHAFGASSVALGPGCADPYSPKAVRASMGAIFAVALARVPDVAALPGVHVALAAHAGRPLRELAEELRQAGALSLLVGAEREGLPADLLAACQHVAHIPIHGDSLNAATAAAIALYELSDSIGPGSNASQRVDSQSAATTSRVQPS